MIGYVTVGTNDFERACAFYDALLEVIDAKRLFSTDRLIAWGHGPDKCSLCVCKPHDEKDANVGNGVMLAIQVENTDTVDALYKKALELGAADEGAPGPRGMPGFYAGYFRDLDGNKLNAFCFGAS